MIKNPEVSIVVAAYNHEKYIRALLESILAQTFKDFELVIVDDGSSDGTPSVIEEFAERYPDKVRFVCQQNKGFVSTINLAFKMSRGKYVAPVGSDDIWLPNKLEEQVRKFKKDSSLSLVYTDLNIIDQDDNIINRFHRSARPYWGKITDQLWLANFISGIVVMYKRELFDRYGYWNERYKIGCDYEFSLRVSPYIKVGYVDKVLASYRVHECSSSLGNEKTGFETLDIREQFLFSHPNLIKKHFIKLGYSNAYFMIAEGYAIQNDRKNAPKYYLKACLYNPLLWQGYMGLIFTLIGINYYRLKQIIKKRFMYNGRFGGVT